MTGKPSLSALTRRDFLKVGGSTMAAGIFLITAGLSSPLRSPARVRAAAPAAGPRPRKDVHLVGTDGWAALPVPPALSPWHPDPLAPSPRTTYVFGFRDVTGLPQSAVNAQKNKAQLSAPILWVDEGTDLVITLTNLGLALRPDLTDSHTIHFHGFRDAIPLFDGVPEMSVAVPIGREFSYFYRPDGHPGTYMYHCHFEDVEHVHMGMTGVIYIRPAQNQAPLRPGERYVYNDGDGSTRYDREFVMFLSEVWAEGHYRDAHIQESDFTQYRADFWLLNGRTYPDTLEPNGSYDASGNPVFSTPAGERLQYQPISSLVRANAGEKVLLRFVNLGYQQHAMILPGIPMRVVGKDAVLLRGRDGTDLSYLTETIYIGPGESYDAIFTAPAVTSESTYLLYNRAYGRVSGTGGLPGQTTHVVVSPAGSLPPQDIDKPNT